MGVTATVTRCGVQLAQKSLWAVCDENNYVPIEPLAQKLFDEIVPEAESKLAMLAAAGKKAAEAQAEPERPVAPASVVAVEKVAPAEKPDWIPQQAEFVDRGWKIGINDYDIEPERFQFRAQPFGRSGVVDDRLAKVKKWDKSKEKNILLWVDPKDMRPKLIQGHYQTDLGKRLGVKEIQPLFLTWEEAPTAKEARLIGTLSNLREGHVDPVEVARFMIGTGAPNLERLQEDGIPATGKVFQDGQALSRLDAALFQDITRGRLRERYGVAAGQASGEAVDQKKIVEVLQKREDRTGDPVDAKLAMRIANRVAQADTTTETEIRGWGFLRRWGRGSTSAGTLFGPMETQARG